MSEIKFKKISSRRPAGSEIKAVAKIFKQCFPSQKKARLSYLEKITGQEIKAGHRYILAKKGKEVAGFISWRVWGEPRHRLAELYHVAVSPKFGGQGIGTALVKELIRQANQYYRRHKQPGIRKLFVLTHADNIPAHGLYKKAGLKRIAKLPDFFHKGVDEFIFSKDWQGIKLT